MKHLIALSLAYFLSFSVNAQNIHLKAVSFGIMVPVYGISSAPFPEKPFELGIDLAPSINLITNKTHHHLRYGVDGNNIQLINGYFLKNDWDTYVFYSKNLNQNKHYLGFGTEKLMLNSPQFLIFGFGEIGTDLMGKKLFSFGVVLHPNVPIWQKY